MPQRQSPMDATGRRMQQLSTEHAAEQRRRAQELGMARAAEVEILDQVVDLTSHYALPDADSFEREGPWAIEGDEAEAFRTADARNLPLGATKQPGQTGVSVDVDGIMTDSGQPGWSKQTNDKGWRIPVISSVTTATVGGTILRSVATSYRVSALLPSGETPASAAGTVTTGAGTDTNANTVNWAAVTGATGYRVYGRTAGAEQLLATVGAVTTWVDTGAVTPAGVIPPAGGVSNAYPTGPESPFRVPGGTYDDQLLRPIVDTKGAGYVGAPGGPDPEAPRQWTVARDEVEFVGTHEYLQPETPTQIIRLNTKLEDVTIGAGTNYTFEEGQLYRVPKHVADLLEEKGYIFH